MISPDGPDSGNLASGNWRTQLRCASQIGLQPMIQHGDLEVVAFASHPEMVDDVLERTGNFNSLESGRPSSLSRFVSGCLVAANFLQGALLDAFLIQFALGSDRIPRGLVSGWAGDLAPATRRRAGGQQGDQCHEPPATVVIANGPDGPVVERLQSGRAFSSALVALSVETTGLGLVGTDSEFSLDLAARFLQPDAGLFLRPDFCGGFQSGRVPSLKLGPEIESVPAVSGFELPPSLGGWVFGRPDVGAILDFLAGAALGLIFWLLSN